MSVVASNSLKFHPGSYGDFGGRVFFHDGGLYRGVAAGRAALYRKLIDDGTVRALVDAGLLVETQPADLRVDGFDLVLKHRLVPVVTYAYEWPARMLKDAALVVLDLELELSARGLTLQDAHPWNVLFDGPTPCWVDFGSIVPARADVLWRAYDEFCNFYLHPLLVMAEGHHRVARRLLTDSDDGVTQAEAVALTGSGRSRSLLEAIGQRALSVGRRVVPSPIRGIWRGGARRADQSSGRDVSAERPEFLRELRDKIAGIPSAAPRHAAVQANGRGAPEAMDAGRAEAVRRAVADVRPASVFEVSYESPFYAPIAARAGVRCVAVTVDEQHAEAMYERARRDRLNVLPLVMDFRTPSPGLGVCGQTSAPATDRLRADLVVALDVVHQLGVRYRMNFDQIARALGTFANAAVLVDFVDGGGHPSTRAYWGDGGDFAWYTPEALQAALRRHFARVEQVDGAAGNPTFLCHKGGQR